MIISVNAQKWLKSFHVWIGCTWASAGMILFFLNIFLRAESGEELYGYDMSMKFVDDFIIIPFAILTLLTGILYATLTKWGWFKHRWIIVKWIIAVGGILFGTFFLGPWLNSLSPISKEYGLKAYESSEYLYAKNMNLWFGAVQVGSLIFAIFISFFKPWKKTC